MSNQYSSYLRVTPSVLRLGGVKKVTIHARQKHVLKQLDSVARILVYPVGSTVPTAGNLLSVTEVTPFERLDNGDIVFPVETTIEGAYTVHLSAQKEDGSFSEIMVIELYALADDLFDLRPFKGDFHMHSNCSDGKEDPEYVAATCRRTGFDFMALTDHHKYEPSLRAVKAMADFGCDMLVCPGEEIHLPGNPNHIVNFGGKGSVNALARSDEEKYRAEVAGYMKQLPDTGDELARFQVAASEWTFDRVRDFGGIAMFCHPFWQPVYHNFIGYAVVDMLFERNKFDVFEAVGGFYKHQVECNMLSISRYCEERAKGKKLPVAGVSDCHGCDSDLMGWYYTIVFADKLEFDSIAEAIRDERSVAVHWIPGEHPVVTGPFRLTKFVYFLLREVFPQHDELCAIEGDIMRRALAGEEPDAVELIAKRKGSVQQYMDSMWEN